MIRNSIKAGLALALVNLVWLIFPARVMAQTPSSQTSATGAELYFNTQNISSQAGQPVTLPLLVTTQGKTVDGLELKWQFSGITVSDVQLTPSDTTTFTVVKNQVSEMGGDISLIPSSPLTPFSTNQLTTIATLTFTPTTAGDVTITYDPANTLVASHETSQNIAAVMPAQTLSIAGTLTTQVAPEISPSPRAIDPAINPILMLVMGLIAIVVIGVVAFILFKFLSSERQPPVTTVASQVIQPTGTPYQPEPYANPNLTPPPNLDVSTITTPVTTTPPPAPQNGMQPKATELPLQHPNGQ